MAYAAGYDVDVFICYPMEAEEWTAQFAEALKKELLFELGKDVDVYFAKRDWKLGKPSNGMLDKARSAAVFLAVLTPSSVVASDSQRFAELEMRAFCEKGAADGFCPILLRPIDSKDIARLMPVSHPGSPGSFWKSVDFFRAGPDGVPRIFRYGSDEYNDTVLTVAYHLKTLLEGLHAAKRAEAPFSGKTVLLAPTTILDLQDEMEKVRNLLRNDGVRVLPETDYPRDEAERGERIAEDLQKADLFVQLLSHHQWIEPDDWDRAKQIHALAEQAGRPILQWRKQREPSQRMSEDDNKFFTGPTVTSGGLEEFKRSIRDKVKELSVAAQKSTPQTESGNYYICVAADKLDVDTANELRKIADKKADTELVTEHALNWQLEDKLKWIKESNLAAGIVFLYGDAKRAFIDGWLGEYLKKTRILKIYPKVAALYYTPRKKNKKPHEEPGIHPQELRVLGSPQELRLKDIENIWES